MKRKNFFIGLFIVLTQLSFGQTKEKVVMPEFKGGDEKLFIFLRDNVKYPGEARERCITGIVYISFVVDTIGNIDSVTVSKASHTLLNNEAVRVVKTMSGKWNPGSLNGKNVKVLYSLPISFKLDGCSDNKDTYFIEGVEYYNNHKIEEAIISFKDVLEYDKYDFKTLNRLANIYIELKDYDSACIYLNRIKETGKKNVDDLIIKYCKR